MSLAKSLSRRRKGQLNYMKVKLLIAMAGVHHAFRPGQIVDLPDADAERMLDRGLAEPVDDQSVPAAKLPVDRPNPAPEEEFAAVSAPARRRGR